MGFGDLADRCRIERRGIVDEYVESAEPLLGVFDEFAQPRRGMQVETDGAGTALTPRVELGSERRCFAHRAMTMDDDVGACGVQRARDGGADTASASCDKSRFAGEWSRRGHGDEL